MSWQPISTPKPIQGELYYLPERIVMGIAKSVWTDEQTTWASIDTGSVSFLAEFHPTWLERADRPEPDWTAEPVELPAARLDFACYALTGVLSEDHLIEGPPNMFRANFVDGSFVCVIRGEQSIASLFSPKGKRVLGMAAAGETPLDAVRNLENRLTHWKSVNEHRKRAAPFSAQDGEKLIANFTGDIDRLVIERQLAAGEPVPLSVLAAYPDLIERYGIN